MLDVKLKPRVHHIIYVYTVKAKERTFLKWEIYKREPYDDLPAVQGYERRWWDFRPQCFWGLIQILKLNDC